MGKLRSPNRDKALEIYIEHKGNITPRAIADMLGESSSNINSWKNKDKWDLKLPPNKGGAPKGNLNSLRHGIYADESKREPGEFLKKYIPAATEKIISETVEARLSSLDILWVNIQLQWAAIIRSQKIMHVTNKKEMIKELKKIKVQKDIAKDKKSGEEEPIEVYREEEYEFQFAWDRQATLLNSQSKAMATLQNMISKYEELLHKDWNLATEEQKLRIKKLNVEINKITGEDEIEVEDDGFLDALKGRTTEAWSNE